MTYAVHPVTNSKDWDEFLVSESPDTFLQSWSWNACNKKLGETSIPLGAYENGTLIGVALALTVTAKRGSFLFCPHGPITKKREAYTALLEGLIKEARSRGARFLRISPLLLNTPENYSVFQNAGFRNAPIHMHAETMWILDITPPEEQLLSGMRKTTRNLIRRAGKEGVRVRFSSDQKDLEAFCALYEETAVREKFVPFSRSLLTEEFQSFLANNTSSDVLLALAEHNGEPLAGAIVPIFGTSGFYHQGASSRKRPKIPAAYLLHWEIIRALKQKNIEQYNFWGIAPRNDRNHPWSGLTRFKTGFGGREVEYLHAQDIPLSPMYWVTYIIEHLRKRRRGY